MGGGGSSVQKETTVQGGRAMEARFMEIDGIIFEIQGETGGIKVVPRNQEGSLDNNKIEDKLVDKAGEKDFEKNKVVIDPKRKRVEHETAMGYENGELQTGLIDLSGLKNVTEAGPGFQARLK